MDAGPLARTAPAAVAAATAEARAEVRRIAERRAQAADLADQHDAAVAEQQVAKMLGNLLRSDKFPEWLESAALDTLVLAASESLAELSGGQFELTHRDGEFFVVDHADADSPRSVRTLSGGETFQASLALALALSSPAVRAGRRRRRPARLDLPRRGLRHPGRDHPGGGRRHAGEPRLRRPDGRRHHPRRRARRAGAGPLRRPPRRTHLDDHSGDRMTAAHNASRRRRPGMRFSVDAWDPAYGSSVELEEDLSATTARIVVDVELARRPVAPGGRRPGRAGARGGAVRRRRAPDRRPGLDRRLPDADRAWTGEATMAVCASYAAGVVCCCEAGAHVTTARYPPRRCSPSPRTPLDVVTRAGTYVACHTAPGADMSAAGDALGGAAAAPRRTRGHDRARRPRGAG